MKGEQINLRRALNGRIFLISFLIVAAPLWHDDAVILDSGIDYFTTTSTDAPTSRLLLLQADKLLYLEQAEGFYVNPWRMAGYNGWKCGRLQFGERTDGAIVRLSSSLAASYWYDLFQTTGRCSRIDLQCTLRFAGNPRIVVQQLHGTLDAHQKGLNHAPRLTLWTDNENGATAYLGARASALYCRIYNKEAQSKLDYYRGCVRVEVEVKNRLCGPVIAHLLRSSTVQSGVYGYLSKFLVDRGVPTNLSPDVPHSFYECPAIASDRQKSLAWLAVQVKPTVQLLVDCGCLVEVLNVLGLSNYVEPLE